MEVIAAVIAGVFSIAAVFLNHHLSKQRPTEELDRRSALGTYKRDNVENSVSAISTSDKAQLSRKPTKTGGFRRGSQFIGTVFLLFSMYLIGVAVFVDPDIDQSFFIAVGVSLFASIAFFQLAKKL